MKNAGLYLIVPLLLVSFSCNPPVDQEKLNKLDEQISEVDSCLAKLTLLDTSLVLKTFDSLVTKIEYIQKYQTDTIALETAQLLSRYYGLGKLIDGFANSTAIEEQLKISKQQFQDLRHDYTQDMLMTADFEEFFHIESKDFELLEQKIQIMEKSWEEFQKKIQLYNPKVDSIINSIESKKDSLKI